MPVPSAIALGGRWNRRRTSVSTSPTEARHPAPAGSTDRDRSRGAEPGQRPESQSQSFFRSYGSGLPTSLTYIDLSTRGCAPRRPAADMGTIRRDTSAFPSHGFSRAWREFPGRRPVLATLLAKSQNPLSLREVSRASAASGEKKTLPEAPAGVSVSCRVTATNLAERAEPEPPGVRSPMGYRFRCRVPEFWPVSLSPNLRRFEQQLPSPLHLRFPLGLRID